MTTIPVIDMQDYHSAERHHIFIQNLRIAMSTVGFVAVINADVDPKILDRAYAAAAKFYAQDAAIKLCANDRLLNGQRGYVCSEQAQGQTKKDHKEFYHIGRDYSAQVSNKYGYPSNIWPNNQIEFKLATQELMQSLDKYSLLIGTALAESIGEDANFFNNMTIEGACLLRSIYYPANPPKDCVWAAEHTDIDLFTILPRATEKGLQIQQNGQWIDVIVPDGAFIINAGDLLENLTNGFYKSAKHRVVSTKENIARYSMVTFIHPRPNDRMDPLKKFVDDVGAKLYPDATAQELLFCRLAELGLLSEDGLDMLKKSRVIERLQQVNRASEVLLKIANPYVTKLKARL